MKIYEVTTLVMDKWFHNNSQIKGICWPRHKEKPYINHTKKGFPGSLVELSNTHKVLKNLKVRTHIERCFTYYVHQAEENSENMASDLRKIVLHLYGKKTVKFRNERIHRWKWQAKILQLSYYFEIRDNFYDYQVCIGTIA